MDGELNNFCRLKENKEGEISKFKTLTLTYNKDKNVTKDLRL